MKEESKRLLKQADRELGDARKHIREGEYSLSDSCCRKAAKSAVSAYMAEAGDGSNPHECAELRQSLYDFFASGCWPPYTSESNDLVREGSAAMLHRTEQAVEWVETAVKHDDLLKNYFLEPQKARKRLAEEIAKRARWDRTEADTRTR